LVRFLFTVSFLLIFVSCVTKTAVSVSTPESSVIQPDEVQIHIIINNYDNKYYINYYHNIAAALANAHIPHAIAANIQEEIKNDSLFINELNIILQSNPAFWILVDKQHSLADNYVPPDLVLLGRSSYVLNRANMYLQKDAAESLEEMSAAARKLGLTLVVSSTYRSFNYQGEVYARYVNQMGRIAADRVSARPGHSQHQLGLVVDFGSITNEFASTREGRWLAANASSFGWSLSYPRDMEHITGYSWESWHYRYVGIETARFIDKYFEGIQQYALRFLHEYKTISAGQ